MDKIVCNCMNVTVQDVKDAIDKGASNLEEVKEVTGAATVCGACEEYLTSVVDEFLK
ncbi:(2Fe-2S)-binding protein [Anaeromicropila herbilytica]|nr:(2Fe-2S)-binding protein [Anaeromicropila herbilytica]